jgi:serine phosphatase RsbU (regulator of sigma subunit)
MASITTPYFWQFLSRLGVEEDTDIHESRTYVLNNQITGAITLVLSALIILFRVTIPENLTIVRWMCFLLLILGFSLYLNSRGAFKFNQILLGTGLAVFVLGATIHSKLNNPGLIHEGSYYNPRYFLIGLCFIPFVVFELKDKWLWISVATNMALLIFYNQIHVIFGADPVNIMGEGIKSYSFISIASSASSVTIVLSLYFLKSANSRYEQKINSLLQVTKNKQEEIESSIRYARRLQDSIVSKGTGILKVSDNTACLNLPKDVLSGDFFIYDDSDPQKPRIGVADCTGHGVPGAFLSILAHKTITGYLHTDFEPGKVLTETNASLYSDLEAQEKNALKNGMDIGLVTVDRDQQLFHLSNARSNVFLLTKSGVQRLDSQRISIGEKPTSQFQTLSFKYQVGDTLILSSDGFPDQFGGPKNKKLGRKRLIQKLEELKSSDLMTIMQQMQHFFFNWKNGEEQTDDVCFLVHKLD